MIEQKLENKVIEKIKSSICFEDVKTMGVWQSSEIGVVKNVEDESDSVFLTVNLSPRKYNSPTIPTAEFEVEVNLISRTDIDYNGVNFLSICDDIYKQIQKWQNDINEDVADFSIYDEFDCTGFQIANGKVEIDNKDKINILTINIIIFGVIS